MNNKAIVVIAGRNVVRWVERCLSSVMTQDYLDIGVVFIDDASTDDTFELASKVLKRRVDVHLSRNPVRQPKLLSWSRAVRETCTNPESVIFWLDADDWFTSSTAVSEMMKLHETYDVVWSRYEDERGTKCLCGPLDPNMTIRKQPWVSSALRTFKKKLFDRIDEEDFLDWGRYFESAIDQAIMLPILEMAGFDKCHFHDKVLYHYTDNPDRTSSTHEKMLLGLENEKRIRAKRPYGRINGLSVAYVMPTFAYGGSEMNFYRLGREARRQGWRVGLFAMSHAEKEADFSSWVDEAWKGHVFSWQGDQPELVEKLSTYSVIHLTNLLEPHRILLKGKLPDKPFFETWHGMQALGWIWPNNRLMDGDRAECRFCVSPDLVEAVRKMCGGEVELSMNPVYVPKTTAKLSNGGVVTMVGRMDAEKNQTEFVEILAKVPGIKGVIVGDADPMMEGYRRAVELKAKELGVDLTVTGYVRDPTHYLMDSDVVLHTARMENQPLAILEAMACGVPVVAKAVGGIPSMVEHQKDCFLYMDQPWAVRWLNNLLRDKKLALEVGVKARAKVAERHDVTKCWAAHEKRYLASLKREEVLTEEVECSMVSVVVSSYNQMRELGLFLESMLRQMMPIEVIVADDGSTDGTQEWVENIKGFFPFKLVLVTRKHEGYRLASLNNLGAKLASGSRILFTNADVVHCPNSIRVHSSLPEEAVGAGNVKGVSEEDAAPFLSFGTTLFERLEKIADEHPVELKSNQKYIEGGNIVGVWGGNMSVSKVLFSKVGGHDDGYEGWGGEDADLTKRCLSAGGRIRWLMGSVVVHLGHPMADYAIKQSGSGRFLEQARHQEVQP